MNRVQLKQTPFNKKKLGFLRVIAGSVDGDARRGDPFFCPKTTQSVEYAGFIPPTFEGVKRPTVHHIRPYS